MILIIFYVIGRAMKCSNVRCVPPVSRQRRTGGSTWTCMQRVDSVLIFLILHQSRRLWCLRNILQKFICVIKVRSKILFSFSVVVVVYWLGIVFSYRIWNIVFGMNSTPWHLMDNSPLDVRPAFLILSELTDYYFNPP